MPENTHLETVSETERLPEPVRATPPEAIHDAAEEFARALTWLPNTPSSHTFAERSHARGLKFKPIFAALARPMPKSPVSEHFHWLYDSVRLLYTEVQNVGPSLKPDARIAHVRTPSGASLPRVLALAEQFLEVVSYDFNEQELTLFLDVFQQTTPLNLRELWALGPALRLVLLEQIAERGQRLLGNPLDDSTGVGACVRSLRDVVQSSWKDVIEPLMAIDHVLCQDPAKAYAQMDFESREFYRKRVANLAKYSDMSEMEVAKAVVALAEEAPRRSYEDSRIQYDPRTALRQSHVGYYLIDKGQPLIHQKARFRPPFIQKIQMLVRKHPDEFFLTSIHLLTLVLMSAAVIFLTDANTSLSLILDSMLFLFLPSSQTAVQLMNYLVTSLLPAEILPKLDFSDGVPDDCVTMVAVPTLLLNEQQVRDLVENLEVRYLGNHDSHIHFALLTDLPDSREPAREDNPLVVLCSELIRELNAKYASQNSGSFYLFHRHRAYNPREKSWMGWERKRGKLLDLNKLLRGQYDSFPVKVGDLSILPKVRFVITLDSDTELPRGTAQRLIGTLAHPLNQAIVDPEKNIVVAGYGILQPRVRVSVQSASRSRLANIYSGQTGFDIYTRAVSDVYQDLYCEGIFAGKGIYEVAVVQRVLEHRFPQNALLSHDLIEGAYARAGLVTDIEVVEDYPSHYSAYNRRKHRWLRGDWQITGWLLPHVPDETGRKVRNPISLVSQWKILDNLRRSLVEPATFLLFALSWLTLPVSARNWTISAICILFVPVWFEFFFALIRSIAERKLVIVRDALRTLFIANFNVFLNLVFLAHQMLVSMDAVVRTLVRRMFTRQRLLEWETAAEAEIGGHKRTPVDIYLDWIPLIVVCLAGLVYFVRRPAFFSALPILVLWASSKAVSVWLNRPPQLYRSEVSDKDKQFLRTAAVRTWRYFAEFSTHEHNWLIPDNVQEEPFVVAARVSPTNVGLLLNARQVACEFGYLTQQEFVDLSAKTLRTLRGMQRYRGHLYNWYDTRTLEPLPPLFISSVDSGNLVASLWTLQQGCLHILEQPA